MIEKKLELYGEIFKTNIKTGLITIALILLFASSASGTNLCIKNDLGKQLNNSHKSHNSQINLTTKSGLVSIFRYGEY